MAAPDVQHRGVQLTAIAICQWDETAGAWVPVETLGGLADEAVTDHEAASASIPALLRGILAAVNTIATNTSGG